MIEEANVVPVYKGGSRNVATNYRPISLTSQLCKVFETIVRDHCLQCYCLQCFDAVDWVAGRASGL